MYLKIYFIKSHVQHNSIEGEEGGQICHYLGPSIELGQNMSYSTEMSHSRYFYGKQLIN